VRNPVLEQVADPVGAAGEQLGRVPRLDVLREDQHGHLGMVAAQVDGRSQPLVGVGGWHADVDDRDIRRLRGRGHGPAQRVGVGHCRHDLEPPVGQQLNQPVPQYGGVLGDHDSQRLAHAPVGSSTVTVVGPPAGLTTWS
jgi:hypothetical protein